MFGLERWKDALGEPGKGAHAIRFLGVAVVDVALTVLAAALIAWFQPAWPFWKVLVALFLLGILLHWLFGVRTAVARALGA